MNSLSTGLFRRKIYFNPTCRAPGKKQVTRNKQLPAAPSGAVHLRGDLRPAGERVEILRGPSSPYRRRGDGEARLERRRAERPRRFPRRGDARRRESQADFQARAWRQETG